MPAHDRRRFTAGAAGHGDSNGFWHSFYFTTGTYPDVIRLRPKNARVADDACVKCHGGIAGDLGLHGEVSPGQACIRCHSQVGHMR